MPQGSGGIKGPATASQGSSVEVTISTPDSHVFVSAGGKVSEFPVQDGKATIPVPSGVAPGQSFFVFVGKGPSMQMLRIEVTNA